MDAFIGIDRGMWEPVWQELDYRIDVCRITKMAHIEHLQGNVKEDPVELVSLFSTIADLARLPPLPKCPVSSYHIEVCTEGQSLTPYLTTSKNKGGNNETVAYSSYPRPSNTPQWNSDKPNLKDIKIMGYSMRTIDYRFTAWVGYNPITFEANFTDVHSQEFYFVHTDPNQDNNLFNGTNHSHLLRKLFGNLKISSSFN